MHSKPLKHECLVEDVARDLSLLAKMKNYTSIGCLAETKVQGIAAILFTAGSEARSKAVPLTNLA